MDRLITNLDKLREPSEPLKFIDKDGQHLEEGKEIINQLNDVFEKNTDVVALSAPQIGINKRIFGIRFNDTIKYFINPIITKKSGLVIAPEIFLNSPGKEYLIGRPKEVTVVYTNQDFVYEDNKLLDSAARIFDQMIQVLDGVLPSDLGLESDIELDGTLAEASEEELATYCEIWKQFITVKLGKLEEEINSNDLAKRMYSELKLSESIINGRIEVYEEQHQPHLNYKQRRALKKIGRRSKKINNEK